jgi:hypothetical protein
MTVAVEREPEAVAGARQLGLPEPNVRSIFRAGAPRFARELFGPVAGFYIAYRLGGLAADSAVVYLAQPVIVSAIWGVANLVSAAIGRPLMGVFADAWYPFPDFVKQSRTYRRIFGLESVVWGVYLLARSGLRMLVLSAGSIGVFVGVQFVTGIPVVVALVIWSLWYAVRGFERSTEWDD